MTNDKPNDQTKDQSLINTSDTDSGYTSDNQEPDDIPDLINHVIDYTKAHIGREEIQELLNIRPINIFPYQRALVHKSVLKYTQNNPNSLEYMKDSYERYEYLGDSILNMVVAEYLFNRFPDKHEGFLTRIRTKLVNRQNLSFFARKLNLGPYILMGYNVEKINGRNNDRILEDTFESLVCAIKLDLGLERARRFIIGMLEEHINFKDILIDSNYKDILLRFCQSKLGTTPNYEIAETKGPPHNRQFKICCVIQGIKYEHGIGKSKKDAEQQSAFKTLNSFNVLT